MVQRLVETAMLAAVGGVVYTVASILKLQSYLGYFQPMPIVVSAMRWGPAAGRKTMTATCFLLLGNCCCKTSPAVAQHNGIIMAPCAQLESA